MTLPRLADVLRDVGVPDLLEILGERLSAPELETISIEVHRQRAGRMTAAELLACYERDQYVRPSRVGASRLATIDRYALRAAVPPFEALDLSPLCPIGTVSTLAPVDPVTALGAGSGNEVISDCTTVLALESALRRRAAQQAGPTADQHVRLCASHRELRIPFSAAARSEPHTRVFGLSTAGEDAEGLRFAAWSLHEQLGIHLHMLEELRKEGSGIGLTTVAICRQPVDGLEEMLRGEVIAPLAEAFPSVRLLVTGTHPRGRRYYTPVSFTVTAEDHAEVAHTVAFGGFTDWGRQLLGREEERLLVSTLATEVMWEGFGTEAPRGT
jgi:hypothetical protein